MHINSYAKVNLYLKIGKKLKNNYHAIQTVMLPIQLHDKLYFERLEDDKIIIESTNKELENEKNIAYKAALLLKKKYQIKGGAKIAIEKNVPLASGLGGGSSNAANVLIALNKLWGLKLNQKKLMRLAAEIGSDVPFFIIGKASLVEGAGEKIKVLKKSSSLNLVLVNPGIKVSTAWAYKQFDKAKIKPKDANKKDIKKLIKAINKKDIKKIAENMHNDFSQMLEKKYKIIKEIKSNLKKFDALSSSISGSGPTVLGLFDSIYPAREAYFRLKNLYPFVYLTKTF
ncbi:4-(cytidine 5'-diphospho)-2-C-methyl-D-erythritol kinase [Candidatus Woesearchaeota archaeon]|nr:4-(cytidine 5'-diphospho)-2-C-methyl-D-erythritol kinase [Candidatus Woesearchaeota archaeon]